MTADRRTRLASVGVLVMLAIASLALLVSGAGDKGTGYAAPPVRTPSRTSASPATPVVSASPAASAAPPSRAAAGASIGAAPTTAVTPVSAGDWRSLLAALDARRARAYETADVAMIDEVYAPGPDQRKDHARVAALAKSKRRVLGLRLTYRDVRVLTSGATTATLDVIDELPPYREVDSLGRLIKAYPGRTAKRWVITLTRTAGEWRVAAIASAT